MKKSFGAVTLIVPTPVWCVRSYDRKGSPNVMAIFFFFSRQKGHCSHCTEKPGPEYEALKGPVNLF
jgi:hypothetical protein